MKSPDSQRKARTGKARTATFNPNPTKARTATFNPNPTTLRNFRLKAPTLGAMVAELSRRMKGGLINTNGLCGK